MNPGHGQSYGDSSRVAVLNICCFPCLDIIIAPAIYGPSQVGLTVGLEDPSSQLAGLAGSLTPRVSDLPR